MHLLYNFIFIIVTICILLKTIFYGLYEINSEKNKSGGISVICFSVLVVIFSNIIVFLR